MPVMNNSLQLSPSNINTRNMCVSIQNPCLTYFKHRTIAKFLLGLCILRILHAIVRQVHALLMSSIVLDTNACIVIVIRKPHYLSYFK